MRIILYVSPDDEIFLVDRDAPEVVKFSPGGSRARPAATEANPNHDHRLSLV